MWVAVAPAGALVAPEEVGGILGGAGGGGALNGGGGGGGGAVVFLLLVVAAVVEVSEGAAAAQPWRSGKAVEAVMVVEAEELVPARGFSVAAVEVSGGSAVVAAARAAAAAGLGLTVAEPADLEGEAAVVSEVRVVRARPVLEPVTVAAVAAVEVELAWAEPSLCNREAVSLLRGYSASTGNSVIGGAGGLYNAGNGSGLGSGIFLQGSGTITFQPGSGQTQTIYDTIADEVGVVAHGYTPPGGTYVGTESWNLTKSGAGTLVPTGINNYSGATNVNEGALEVDGSIASSRVTIVNNGATLLGIGTVRQCTNQFW